MRSQSGTAILSVLVKPMGIPGKYCQLALLFTLGLGTELSALAQALPAGAVLVASEAAPGGDGLFPELLGGTHPAMEQAFHVMPVIRQALPTPLEEMPATPVPLTGKDRLLLFWSETYATPGLWVGVGAGALVDQLRHTPLKWDGDGNGYTRRFASEYGQLAARNAIHDALSAFTGLDPRYAVCKCQGRVQRSAHALRMTFVANRQDGRLMLDVPQIASAYGSGMVSTLWFPHRQFNPMVQGIQFGHEQMGEILVSHLVQEFGPDLQRRLHLHSFTARRIASPDDDD